MEMIDVWIVVGLAVAALLAGRGPGTRGAISRRPGIAPRMARSEAAPRSR